MAEGDRSFVTTRTGIAQRIAAIFRHRGVSLLPGEDPGRTAEERLDDIVERVWNAGDVEARMAELDDVRRSADWIYRAVPEDRIANIDEDQVAIPEVGGAGAFGSSDTGAAVMGRRRLATGDLGDTAEIGDARAYIEQLLADYGLEELADYALDQLRSGRSQAEVVQLLRDTEEFKARFPAIEQRRERGLAPISPAQYIEYERGVRQLMRESGMPGRFFDDPDDFRQLLVEDVSLQEVADRVQEGFERVAEAPAVVREQFEQLFGVGGRSALAAFFLDPDRALPELERAVATAEVSGAATMAGFNVGRNRADDLASFGFSFDQALEGFSIAARTRPFASELTFERTDVTEDQLIDAAFNLDPEATEAVRRRQEGRQAPFQRGDRAQIGEEGFLGTGSA